MSSKPPYELEKDTPKKKFEIEFYCYQTPLGTEIDLGPLIDKLASDDDTKRYEEYHNGCRFEKQSSTGHTVIEVLPQLKGLPWNNLILAYLHAVRPSNIRVSRHGEICCDGQPWRVTVYLTLGSRIERIEQEVEVGYSSGADIDQIHRDVRAGRISVRSRIAGQSIGNTDGLARVDFS